MCESHLLVRFLNKFEIRNIMMIFFSDQHYRRTWFMCFVLDFVFFTTPLTPPWRCQRNFFLMKEDCAKFLHGYFQKCWDIYYTLSSHLLEICNVIITLQKYEICAKQNVPMKRFKIRCILCIINTHVIFMFLISCNLIFLPYECVGLCGHRPGHS